MLISMISVSKTDGSIITIFGREQTGRTILHSKKIGEGVRFQNGLVQKVSHVKLVIYVK